LEPAATLPSASASSASIGLPPRLIVLTTPSYETKSNAQHQKAANTHSAAISRELIEVNTRRLLKERAKALPSISMLRRIRVLLQVMIAVLALFVTSGLVHFTQDLYELVNDSIAHHDDDCSSSDDNCPPACPDCHCSRGGYPAPIVFDPGVEPADVAELIETWDPPKDPGSPDRDSLFRPPRA
jgi:hypothetical protein